MSYATLLRPGTPRSARRSGERTEASTVQPLDVTKPNIARVWDYWLGGHFL